MLSSACFVVLVGVPFVCGGWWDDFSNNLATDLAPFISLFGEQVTKQYLSESISALDYFIFAMAPMGILTAVVSAIRVCGSPSLRAFIGRAQEGGGNAEAELCSSTSRDVCELYNNGGIARVFGRPKLLEIIYDPVDQDFTNEAGIYTFRDYINTPKGKEVWKRYSYKEEWNKPDSDEEAGPEPFDSSLSLNVRIKRQLRAMFWAVAGACAYTSEDKTVSKRNVKSRSDDEASPEAFSPNLSLNVGIKRQPRAIFWAVATAGLILQIGVLVFAGIVTYYLQWEVRDGQPEPYACPLAITGTLLVCGGIFFCAFLIGQSTDEQVFRRAQNGRAKQLVGASDLRHSSIIWVQPGGQVLGDQTFDPFCYSDYNDPLQEYLTSWKKRSANSELAVWAGAGITLCGFVLQFIGLRGIHSAVSVAQLGAIIVMSAARAALRMQRLRPEDNFFAGYPDEVVRHELDWLALHIGREHIQRDLDSPPSSPSSPPPGSSGGSPERRYFWKYCGASQEGSIVRSHLSPGGRGANSAGKLLAYRARLAQLTESFGTQEESATSARHFKIEMVEVRREAERLADAIVSAVNAVFSNGSCVKDGQKDECLWWGVNCSVSSSKIPSDRSSTGTEDTPKSQQHTVYLKLCRTEGNPWELENKLDIEALLGLWVWSLVSDPAVETTDRHSSLRISRAIEVTTRRIVSTKQNIEDLKVWLGGEIPGFEEYTLCLGPTDGEPGSLWTRFESMYKPLPGDLFQDFKRQDRKVIRFFGWHAVELSQARASKGEPFKVWSAHTKATLVSSCAQEVFGSFITSILGIVHDMGSVEIGEGNRTFCLQNSLVTEVMRSFTESQLGSRDEALLCVLPPIISRLSRPSAHISLEAARKSANEHRKRKGWREAETVLRWAWQTCTQPNTIEQGRDEQENLVEDHTIPAAIALGELYRWALADKDAAEFGINGIKWLQDQKLSRSQPCCAIIDRYLAIQTRFDHQRDKVGGDGILSAIGKGLTETLLCLTRSASTMNTKEKGDALILATANHEWPEVVLTLLELATEPDFKDPDSRTALSHAAQRGSVDVVRELIKWGAFPNSDDVNRRTPLSYASEMGSHSVAEMLLGDPRVSADFKDNKGQTPLWWAATNGHEAVAKLLLETGKVNAGAKNDSYKQTPLSQAAANGHEGVVKLLLETGEVEADAWDCYGRTALSWAAGNGHEVIARLLLETGQVDADSLANYKRKPLSWAAENGHEAVAKLLLETGKVEADARDSSERTPLWQAAAKGHEAVVKLLLKTGQVNADAQDSYQQTPLSAAAGNGHEAVVKLLLETGKVDIDSRDNGKQTPFSRAAEKGHESVVKLLLETGLADPEARDVFERTPFWQAAGNGHEGVARLLLETGLVDADIRDNYVQTPLARAALNGHEAVVKLLLESGKVDIDAQDNYKQTPFMSAVINGFEAVAKLLLETGQVDVNARDKGGQTPLSRAADHGYEAVIKLLLKTDKVDVDAQDNNGQTPYLRAVANGHKEVARLLLETGQVNTNIQDKGGQTGTQITRHAVASSRAGSRLTPSFSY